MNESVHPDDQRAFRIRDGEEGMSGPVLRELFEKLLQQAPADGTLSAPADGGDVLAALSDAVQAHRGEPFTISPAAELMVRLALGPSLEALAGSPEGRRSLVTRIAETLCDDPAARERLEQLWNGICANAP